MKIVYISRCHRQSKRWLLRQGMSKRDDFPVYASLVDGLNKYNLEVEYYDKSTNLETVLQDNKNTHLFIGISLYKYTFNLNNTKSKKLFQDSNANF